MLLYLKYFAIIYIFENISSVNIMFKTLEQCWKVLNMFLLFKMLNY